MISVCMATYNGEKYIKDQLKSILEQLNSTDEVIISDDGSKDGTMAIIKSLNDARIHLFINKERKGYTKNFENALIHAKGDIIFIADQDDVWKKNKVNCVLKAMQGYQLVIHDAEMTDANLKTTALSHFAKYHVKPGFWRTFIRTRYTGACMAFTKSFKELALPFPPNDSLCPYDYWLAYLGFYKKQVHVISDTLIYYRRHIGTALNAGEYSTRSIGKRIMTRLYCLKELLKR